MSNTYQTECFYKIQPSRKNDNLNTAPQSKFADTAFYFTSSPMRTCFGIEVFQTTTLSQNTNP